MDVRVKGKAKKVKRGHDRPGLRTGSQMCVPKLRHWCGPRRKAFGFPGWNLSQEQAARLGLAAIRKRELAR